MSNIDNPQSSVIPDSSFCIKFRENFEKTDPEPPTENAPYKTTRHHYWYESNTAEEKVSRAVNAAREVSRFIHDALTVEKGYTPANQRDFDVIIQDYFKKQTIATQHQLWSAKVDIAELKTWFRVNEASLGTYAVSRGMKCVNCSRRADRGPARAFCWQHVKIYEKRKKWELEKLEARHKCALEAIEDLQITFGFINNIKETMYALHTAVEASED